MCVCVCVCVCVCLYCDIRFIVYNILVLTMYIYTSGETNILFVMNAHTVLWVYFGEFKIRYDAFCAM